MKRQQRLDTREAMQSALRKQTLVTIAEFDNFLERQGEDAHLFQLVDGVIVMMTNPTRRHGKVAGNIGWHLKGAMDQRGCDVFQGDVRVQRDENFHGFDKPKPDVVVRCCPLDPEADGLNYLVDPVVVVEVLSPGTTDVDRGPKLALLTVAPGSAAHRDRVSGPSADRALPAGRGRLDDVRAPHAARRSRAFGHRLPNDGGGGLFQRST
jgi:Uma2 family endonuclease